MTQKIAPQTKDEKKISDLEKDYFYSLEKEFTSISFKNSLNQIEKWMNNNYSNMSSWAPKNKLALPFQRLIAYQLFRHFKPTTWIYTGPISSDVAFETRNAIINVDAKTVSKTGNFSDWNSLFLKPNQASFDHSPIGKPLNLKNNYPGCPVTFELPDEDKSIQKPILSFFLMALYTDDKKNSKWNFTQNNSNNLRLVCVPNGKLSRLFNYDLGINGAKKWEWKKTSSTKKANKKIIQKPVTNKFPNNFFEIHVASKDGWFDPIKKESWLEFEDKKRKKYYRIFEKLDTVRIKYSSLNQRFDSSGLSNNKWDGVKEWKI
tara:strand:- start:285 stop:1238 length:954 start_codon:yes stop_codon:yes gene_type:complete